MLTEELDGWGNDYRPRSLVIADRVAMAIAVRAVRCLMWLVVMRYRMVERRER